MNTSITGPFTLIWSLLLAMGVWLSSGKAQAGEIGQLRLKAASFAPFWLKKETILATNVYVTVNYQDNGAKRISTTFTVGGLPETLKPIKIKVGFDGIRIAPKSKELWALSTLDDAAFPGWEAWEMVASVEVPQDKPFDRFFIAWNGVEHWMCRLPCFFGSKDALQSDPVGSSTTKTVFLKPTDATWDIVDTPGPTVSGFVRVSFLSVFNVCLSDGASAEKAAAGAPSIRIKRPHPTSGTVTLAPIGPPQPITLAATDILPGPSRARLYQFREVGEFFETEEPAEVEMHIPSPTRPIVVRLR